MTQIAMLLRTEYAVNITKLQLQHPAVYTVNTVLGRNGAQPVSQHGVYIGVNNPDCYSFLYFLDS